MLVLFPHITQTMELIRGVWYALPSSISGFIGWYLAVALMITFVHLFRS